MQHGSVSDGASEALAAVRVERRDNSDALRRLVEEVARGLFAKGASDTRSVTLIRDRYCVAIKVCVCVWGGGVAPAHLP
jgi:DNA mismatch repair protein MutS2